jgi:hypothetical protein
MSATYDTPHFAYDSDKYVPAGTDVINISTTRLRER